MNSDRMDDFVEELERKLRTAARQRGQRLAARRRVIGVGAIMALCGTIGATVALSTHQGVDIAYAAPPVTGRATTDAGDLRFTAPTLVARGARLDEARSLPTPAGEAYLIPIRAGWCLLGPDPAAEDPQKEHGLTCVSASEFMRHGIWLQVGNADRGYVLIAPPAGARPPEVTDPRGSRRRLDVHAGVALISPYVVGSKVTVYDVHNVEREVIAPTPGPSRPDGNSLQDCGNGFVRPPGAC